MNCLRRFARDERGSGPATIELAVWSISFIILYFTILLVFPGAWNRYAQGIDVGQKIAEALAREANVATLNTSTVNSLVRRMEDYRADRAVNIRVTAVKFTTTNGVTLPTLCFSRVYNPASNPANVRTLVPAFDQITPSGPFPAIPVSMQTQTGSIFIVETQLYIYFSANQQAPGALTSSLRKMLHWTEFRRPRLLQFNFQEDDVTSSGAGGPVTKSC
jgi:Flp pilus assembly protein TadG